MPRINCKTKGRRGEQEVCRYWKDLYPQVRRHLEFQVEASIEGVDVILNDKIQCQVKIGKQVPIKIYHFINQIKHEDGKLRFVQMKRDRQEWLVVLKLDDFRKLLKEK